MFLSLGLLVESIQVYVCARLFVFSFVVICMGSKKFWVVFVSSNLGFVGICIGFEVCFFVFGTTVSREHGLRKHFVKVTVRFANVNTSDV